MHELSIALSILDVVEEQAGDGAARVAAVHLKLGRFCGIVKEALLSAYELAREDTPLARAELLIEEIPLVIRCPACAAERTPESLYELRCPVCGTLSSDIVRGQELEVSALEMES